MDRGPEDEGLGLFLSVGIGAGITIGAGFGIGAPPGTVVRGSRREGDGDG